MAAQQRSEETRERILRAAQIAFAEHSYDAAGVAEICQLAGVSKGAFYHHFPTKQAVFLALLDQWLAGLDAQLALYRQEEDVPRAFERMAGVVCDVFRDAAGRLPLFLAFWSQAAHDAVIWQAIITHYHRYTRFFAGMIEAGIARGSLKPIDPDVAACALVSFAVGVVLQGLLDPQGADWGQRTREGVRLWLCSIKKDQSHEKEVNVS